MQGKNDIMIVLKCGHALMVLNLFIDVTFIPSIANKVSTEPAT